MKKKILILVTEAAYPKVRNSLKDLKKYYLFDFYISDLKKNVRSVFFFKIISNIFFKNEYLCCLDFYKDKQIKDIILFSLIKNKIKIIRPILAPKARHLFKEKKDYFYLHKLFKQPKIIINFIYNIFKKFIKHDGYILAGSYSKRDVKNNSGFIIYSHSFDYENLKKKNLLKDKKKKIKKILFLDEMMQHHPDYEKNNLLVPINYKDYLNEINLIFKKIFLLKNFIPEIAFHPKSDKKYRSDFRFVKKYFNNTIYAIKNCDLVIAHGSTTIGIAAVFKKPIVLLISKKMKFTWMEKYVKTIGKHLNCKIYYTDEFLKNINEINLNKLIKSNSNNTSYINKFLSHPKKNRKYAHLWSSFHNYIHNNDDS